MSQDKRDYQLFNPKRFKEARIVRGLSIVELANEIGVSKQAISQYELGESVPRASTMMSIVNILGFPKNFFYKEFKEQYVGNTFFRASNSATKKLREIQYTKAQFVSYIYKYLENFIDFPSLNLPDTTKFNGFMWNRNEIEQLANDVREYWGLAEQPIGNVVNLMERNGILVCSFDMGARNMDAFCQPRQGRPLIALGNDKQSAARRQFDGAHELGHLLMHKDEIYNQDNLTKEEFGKMEEQANRFASAFLLPSKAFADSVTSSSLDSYIELKKYWRVSIGAMLYRSRDLGIITDSRYTSLVKQMSMKKIRVKEPLDDLLPVPQPQILRRSVEMLIENDVKSEQQLLQEVGMSGEMIEMLCGLDKGRLDFKDVEHKLSLIINNDEENHVC
ncbi:Zn-dependent peptidase ImmA (M78 family)/DNA-binding XRE family transcriptional regulator [Paenibacillus forsythiae]|uniref:Zn-dependent peptidase ImmA (M78 family)/DNA-binding XRE family transcriptional regulator n=1 Tax=Paenibacillus forsythiae TaxID=365616 RepID=A0ABU3HH92_9BACL|nr:XRE family transcriptional regulator [Paenibacillus forsythiae]MDT3429030.1 Zn-dependent peptidase ImmA (M78 family)/DNA-binding XRE family transcriptional regulator [Paenibacillus forsythiae]